MSEWISLADRPPPRPPTPYHVYLVWAVPMLHNATGYATRCQFGRDGSWVPVYTQMGDECEVTHWMELPEPPDPKPYGPRGRERGR